MILAINGKVCAVLISVSIEEKVRNQKEVVSRLKDKYDSAVAEFEELMAKREKIQKKELIDTFSGSSRLYEEVMEFLKNDRKKAAE